MRAALYTRISRDDLGEALGVQRQEEDCRRLCDNRGWQVVRTFCDNDLSAYSGRTRPDYQALLQAIGAGSVEAVVAWAPERLHRSPRELEDFLELIERTGCRVETIKAGAWDVSTSHGRLVARMLGAVSRAESERTAERVSRAHQQAKERGLWRGPIPYGMQVGEQPGRPVPDKQQAPVVEGIFDRVLRGDALTRIAADLNAAGVKPRRGQLWTHTGIERLILSPALGGLVEIDGELRPAAFEGVVSAERWRQVRAQLRARPRGESRRPREKLTLLGGILTCAEHGWACVGGSTAYAPTYVANGPGKCNVSITRRAADAFVTEVLLARLSRPDARDLLAPTRPDQNELLSEATQLRQRREELADLVADGLLTATAARPRLAALAQRLQELELVADARSPLTEELLQDPREVWAQWSMPQRREVLRLLGRVTLRHVGPRNGPRADPTRISFSWRTDCT